MDYVCFESNLKFWTIRRRFWGYHEEKNENLSKINVFVSNLGLRFLIDDKKNWLGVGGFLRILRTRAQKEN